METNRIRIGSRESKLAVIQSELVMKELKNIYPSLEFELVTMKTTGDKILDKSLDKIGGKGLFIKELELALLENRVDLCVHSLKDMPMEISEEMPLIGYSRREDPRDVLVLPKNTAEIDFSKPIGTSSARRLFQLKDIFPNASFASVRGNLQTRLKKLDEGQYSALILAAAGLKRLGLQERISRYFEVDEIVPAAGQGIMAIQGRCGNNLGIMKNYTRLEDFAVAEAERALVKGLDGGCSSPIGAHAYIEKNEIVLLGFYVTENMEKIVRDSIRGPIDQALSLGEILADKILSAVK